MPTKHASKRGGVTPSAEWLQFYIESGKSDKDKQFRQTQADVVAHELSLWNFPQQLFRVFVGYYIDVAMVGLALNHIIAADNNTPLIQALIVGTFDYIRSVVAGGPVPDILTFLIAPVWTTMRAGNGNRLHFMVRSIAANLFYSGTALASSYAAAQTLSSQIDTSIVLTIPTIAGSLTVLNVVLGFCAVSFVTVIWCDTLGLGDPDGAWLPRTSCEKNSEREKRDYFNHAVLSAAFFLFVKVTSGATIPLDIGYIFASWSQTTDANSYGTIFLWMIVPAIIALVLLSTLTFLDSDMVLNWSMSLWSGAGRHKHRYGKRKSNAENEEQDDNNDEDEDEDDD